MAEINVEKKKSVWPWIVAAIIVLLLILFLVGVFDADDDVDVVDNTPVATVPVYDATAIQPAMDSGTAAADLERMTGMFTSETMQLELDASGRYSLMESPAGEATGTWSYEPGTNSVQLMPDDGSVTRNFRVEGDNTLVPLDPDGAPAAMMSQLTRQDATGAM